MKKLTEKYGNILLIIGEILIGIIILFEPIKFTKAIIIGIGFALIIIGIIFLIKYFKTDIKEAIKENTLAKGITLIATGLFCSLKTNWFIITFPVLTILYGIIILITGIMKVQWAVDAIRLKRNKWYIIAINAVLSIIFAILIIYNPFKGTTVLWNVIAVVLIVQGILDILNITLSTKKQIENLQEKTIDKEETINNEN